MRRLLIPLLLGPALAACDAPGAPSSGVSPALRLCHGLGTLEEDGVLTATLDWAIDEAGRRERYAVAPFDGERSVEETHFDAHGNTVWQGIDRNGNGRFEVRSEWVRAADGRVLEYLAHGDLDDTPEARTTWTYDDAGRVLEEVRHGEDGPGWIAAHRYDGDLLASVTVDVDADGAVDETVTYTYDRYGRRVRWVQQRADGETIFETETTWLGEPPSLDRVDRVWGSETLRLYDEAGRLVHQASPPEGGEVRTVSDYAYDEHGHEVWARTELIGQVWPDQVRTVTRDYDDRGLLLEEVTETDEALDGTVDAVNRADWAWDCGVVGF